MLSGMNALWILVRQSEEDLAKIAHSWGVMFGLSFLFTTALLFAKAIALLGLVRACIVWLEREVYVHLLIVGHIHPRANLGVRTTCPCFLRSEAEAVQEPITLHGLGQLSLLRPEGCRVLLTLLVLRIIPPM